MKATREQWKMIVNSFTDKEVCQFLGLGGIHYHLIKPFILAFVSGKEVEWYDLTDNVWRTTPEIDFGFAPNEYRIKQEKKFISINGYKVPEPVTSFKDSDTMSYFSITSDFKQIIAFKDYPLMSWWKSAVSGGIVHTSTEAARKHAEALLSFTNGQGAGVEWH
jgi:hypothetical protein